MENNLSEKLLKDIGEFKTNLDSQTLKKLDLDLFERIIKRLESFSSECLECSQMLGSLDEHFNRLKSRKGQLYKMDFRDNGIKLNTIISHLQTKHKLVSEGQNLGIYLPLGLCIGLVFGMTIFDNIALGMPIGMCLGIAIGSSMDADAKKKGMTI